MKKIFVLSFIAAALTITANAQTPQTQDQSQTSQQAKKPHTKNQLGLSSDQQKQMKQISKDQKNKKQSIMNDKTLTEDQKQQQLKSLKSESHKQKSNVLTPDQRAKAKQLKGNKKSNKTGTKKGGHKAAASSDASAVPQQ